MKLAPMRYKDYVWPHNPETYSITFRRSVAVKKVPFGRCVMQDLGQNCRVMEGTGVFAGAGAYDEFKRLATVFYGGGPGLLIHPVWQTAQAYFVSLELTQQPLEDYVRYRFSFWEANPAETALLRVGGTEDRAERAQCIVQRGDSLWGIADRNGTTLGALLKANPQIRNPNEIAAGERVTLP